MVRLCILLTLAGSDDGSAILRLAVGAYAHIEIEVSIIEEVGLEVGRETVGLALLQVERRRDQRALYRASSGTVADHALVVVAPSTSIVEVDAVVHLVRAPAVSIRLRVEGERNRSLQGRASHDRIGGGDGTSTLGVDGLDGIRIALLLAERVVGIFRVGHVLGHDHAVRQTGDLVAETLSADVAIVGTLLRSGPRDIDTRAVLLQHDVAHGTRNVHAHVATDTVDHTIALVVGGEDIVGVDAVGRILIHPRHGRLLLRGGNSSQQL